MNVIEEIKQQLITFKQQGPMVVAVSGGVDSMVLLDALRQIYPASELVVAHFNHGWRAESAAEASGVEAYAHRYGLPFELGIWESGEQQRSEAAARKARYTFFADILTTYQARNLITGHHLDDFVETFLLRIGRGSSLKGLAGMQAHSRQKLVNKTGETLDVDILRPLHRLDKASLYNYAQVRSVPFFEDESNQSDVYTRNRLRQTVLPALEEVFPDITGQVKQALDQWQKSYAVHLAYFQEHLAPFIHHTDSGWQMPRNLWLRLSEAAQILYIEVLFEEVLVEVMPDYSQEAIGRLYKLINQDTQPNQWIPLGNGWCARRAYEAIYIEPEQHQVDTWQSLVISASNTWHAGDGQERFALFEAGQLPDYDSQETIVYPLTLPAGVSKLCVRPWQAGDRLRLVNKTGEYFTKKVSRIFIDEKVPQSERQQAKVLVACDEVEEIIALLAYRQGSAYKATTKEAPTHYFLYQKGRI
ncbi:tRNA lysidine(34) synthetase TilS [Suicoccus acidiformans]|uniref:tRNA(Ile)-lysidine synthase n=1 Tax=Suicoccus acidiformans TaxID=2036206 RepID=A0A347WN79_9LACT|nr:tRNA lysidine(34) synthetase TilS [Suicoccus acidiformans]AXY26536.1 tRNA lysidine(34) synthetase TilS [Suicoccus acidiformans]